MAALLFTIPKSLIKNKQATGNRAIRVAKGKEKHASNNFRKSDSSEAKPYATGETVAARQRLKEIERVKNLRQRITNKCYHRTQSYSEQSPQQVELRPNSPEPSVRLRAAQVPQTHPGNSGRSESTRGDHILCPEETPNRICRNYSPSWEGMQVKERECSDPWAWRSPEGTAVRIVKKGRLQMILPFTIGRKSQMFIIRNGFWVEISNDLTSCYMNKNS